MPIAIQIDTKTGKPICPCCRLNLHHCKKCWSKFHNSHEGKDFESPEYYGQSFIDEEITKEVYKMCKREYNPEVKSDKNRKYNEGEYNH